MKRGWIIGLMLWFPILLQAQAAGQKTPLFNSNRWNLKPSGILNALKNSDRFSMSQSYTLSYLLTGNRGYNQGLYLNNMKYRFSNPLCAEVTVGYLHQPFGSPILAKNAYGSLFIQRATLQYRPSKNTVLSIGYETLPYGYGNPYSF